MATTNPLELDIECFHPPSEMEQTVFNLLISYLPQDSSIAPQQAVEKILARLPGDKTNEESAQRPSREGFLCELWDLMFRVAYQLDYREEPMQRFIILIKVLRERLGNILGDSEDISYFGMMLCEKWQGIPDPQSSDDGNHRRAKNINGLIAHFTNEDIYQGYYRAIGTICHGLECNDTKSRKKIDLEMKKKTIAYRVPTAAIYFVVCAPKLYEACRQAMCEDATATGEMWRGEPSQGYSIARWEFWRSRFGALVYHADATEETRESCKAATEAMDDAVRQAE